MIIIWRGWGILAIGIWLACLVLAQLIVDAVFHQGYYKAEAWPKLLVGAVSGVIIWCIGRAMNGHPDSEHRQNFGVRHSIFWIPMEHWGPIFCAMGIVMTVMRNV